MDPLARVRSLAPRPGFPWSAGAVPRSVERLPSTRRRGSDYETAWARRLPARYARLFLLEGPLRLTVQALAAPTVAGRDRLDALDGPVVFAANHHSHLDAPLLLTAIPEPWRHRVVVAAAADYFFTNRATSAASALVLGAIPVERTKVSRRSAERATTLLKAGWSLLIFPEGGRSPDGWGQGHKGGAAFLALRAGVPVVPVHLEGTNRIFAKGDRTPKPGTTTVTFGEPLQPEQGDDARRFALRIEKAVAILADEAATDWWGARQRAAQSGTPSLSGPETGSWRRAWALESNRREAKRRTWPTI